MAIFSVLDHIARAGTTPTTTTTTATATANLERGEEADCAESEKEDVTGEDGVAEELERLQQTRHVGSPMEVKQRVQKHETAWAQRIETVSNRRIHFIEKGRPMYDPRTDQNYGLEITCSPP